MNYKDVIQYLKNAWSKRSSFGRFGLVFFAVIYLVIPQPFIIGACIVFFFYSFNIAKTFKHWLIIFIPFQLITYALGLTFFIFFLFITTDSVTESEYIMTETPLTTAEVNAYKDMIFELDFYEVDPINTDSNLPFEMLSLVGYKRGYWFNREAIDSPQLLITPFSNQTGDELEIYIYNQFGTELRYYSFMRELDSIITFEVPEDVISLIVQVENVAGDILYDSGEIEIYHDIDFNPNLIAKGGQYDANPLATYVLNALAAHLGALLMITMIISGYNTYHKFTKKVIS
jgi:energy-coupling factor transporter transmembrane protein EcfT